MYKNTFTERYKNIPIAKWFYPKSRIHSPQFITAPEIHKEFEMIYIANGEALININNQTVIAHKGDLVFISPYMIHSVWVNPQDQFSHICYCFDLSILQLTSLQNDLENSNFYVLHHITADSVHNDVLTKCFFDIGNAIDTEMPYWELTIRGNLCLMFALFMQQNLIIKPLSHTDLDRAFCIKVFKHIEQHYKEQIDSQTVAKALDYNQSYFCRLFKKNYNMCFSNYLNMYRLEKSKILLMNSLLSIIEVTYEVGFSNPSYYTKLFRQQNGISPKEFRKIHSY